MRSTRWMGGWPTDVAQHVDDVVADKELWPQVKGTQMANSPPESLLLLDTPAPGGPAKTGPLDDDTSRPGALFLHAGLANGVLLRSEVCSPGCLFECRKSSSPGIPIAGCPVQPMMCARF